MLTEPLYGEPWIRIFKLSGLIRSKPSVCADFIVVSILMTQAKDAVSDEQSRAACDRLAGAPWDSDAFSQNQAVAFRHIIANAAVAACQVAVRDEPGVRRFRFQLGRAYDRMGANGEAYRAYLQAAQLGSAAAKVNIGILYRQGRRFEKNGAKARAWFKEAAEAGLPEGMYCYATALDNGLGGAQDSRMARMWYEKAAERGTLKARDALVRLEIDGPGTGAVCD